MQQRVTLAGHRGWRGKYPENTLLGFRKVLELDVDAIEMDVHMTKDYHIVVCHDANLARTTDTRGIISRMTLEEVRKADAGIKFSEEFFSAKGFEKLVEILVILIEESEGFLSSLAFYNRSSAEVALYSELHFTEVVNVNGFLLLFLLVLHNDGLVYNLYRIL